MKLLISLLYASVLVGMPLRAEELPVYAVVEDVLSESDLAFLNQLTLESVPEKQWYGRWTFWKEVCDVDLSDEGTLTCIHQSDSPYNPVIDQIISVFLHQVAALEGPLAGRQIVCETYFDRNVVEADNAASSGMFWHRDIIHLGGSTPFADYTMILLTNGRERQWSGADWVLQQGGDYMDRASYSWCNSLNPMVTISPAYNQALIFRNRDSGHMVTPLEDLQTSPVCRDVLIVTCSII